MYRKICIVYYIISSEIDMSNHSQTHLFIVIIAVHIQRLIVKAVHLTFTVLHCRLHGPPVVDACAARTLLWETVAILFVCCGWFFSKNILVVAMARLHLLMMCKCR